MSISASRQLFSRILNSNSKQRLKCLVSVRWKSDHADKTDSGKIESAILKNYSEPLHIESIELLPKKIASTEVVIDVNYCALNGLDVLLCENLYSHEQCLPFVPGYEVSGKLVEVGNEAKKAGYNIGDKVIALNKQRFGGLAERCIAEIGDVWKIPSSIKSIDAVCLLENYMTALIGLEQYGSIAEEDIVLANVGVGGIGLAAVDIAANIFRAKVIGMAFSEDRCEKIRERGAFHAFTYKEKKLYKEISEFASERGIEDIFHGDSGEHFKKVLHTFTKVYKSKTSSKMLLRDDNFGVVVQHLSREGRVLICGTADTEEDEKDKDKFTVTGVDLREYRKRKHDLYRTTGDDVITFFEEGLIKPIPAMVAGFYNVNKALKFISEMKSCGKVVIDMKNKDAEAKAQ